MPPQPKRCPKRTIPYRLIADIPLRCDGVSISRTNPIHGFVLVGAVNAPYRNLRREVGPGRFVFRADWHRPIGADWPSRLWCQLGPLRPALRAVGAARAGAYFSTAPFNGALLGLLILHDPWNANLAVAGLFMVVGVWLHLTEAVLPN